MVQTSEVKASDGQSKALRANDRGKASLSRIPAKEKGSGPVNLPGETECFIPGEPIPWARPKPVTRRRKKRGITEEKEKQKNHKYVVMPMTEEKQKNHKYTVMLYLRRSYGNRPPIPKGVPVVVQIDFIFPTPAKKPRAASSAKASRPDIDNLAKQILDAMQGDHAPLAIEDDGQVSMLIVRKMYGDKPGTHVRFWPWVSGSSSIGRNEKDA